MHCYSEGVEVIRMKLFGGDKLSAFEMPWRQLTDNTTYICRIV